MTLLFFVANFVNMEKNTKLEDDIKDLRDQLHALTHKDHLRDLMANQPKIIEALESHLDKMLRLRDELDKCMQEFRAIKNNEDTTGSEAGGVRKDVSTGEGTEDSEPLS